MLSKVVIKNRKKREKENGKYSPDIPPILVSQEYMRVILHFASVDPNEISTLCTTIFPRRTVILVFKCGTRGPSTAARKNSPISHCTTTFVGYSMNSIGILIPFVRKVTHLVHLTRLRFNDDASFLVALHFQMSKLLREAN